MIWTIQPPRSEAAFGVLRSGRPSGQVGRVGLLDLVAVTGRPVCRGWYMTRAEHLSEHRQSFAGQRLAPAASSGAGEVARKDVLSALAGHGLTDGAASLRLVRCPWLRPTERRGRFRPTG